MELREGKAGKFFQCRRCNVVEKLEETSGGGAKGGRKAAARATRQAVEQYSDNVSLNSGLADALKAAMDKNKQE
ncbi:hypothetical protein D3C81_2270470 [compost metagenome]